MSTLDSAMRNDFLLISKSLVPYLNPTTQKPAAILIKALELMYTVEIFSKEDFVRDFSRSHEEGWEKNFLRDIRTDLSDERGYFIDALLKISEVKDILSARNSGAHSDNSQPNAFSASGTKPDDASFSAPWSGNQTSSPQHPSHDAQKAAINPADLINNLSSLLEPNQLQLLKVLTSFMK